MELEQGHLFKTLLLKYGTTWLHLREVTTKQAFLAIFSAATVKNPQRSNDVEYITFDVSFRREIRKKNEDVKWYEHGALRKSKAHSPAKLNESKQRLDISI